jgi:uncharacterized protein YydD (DUF2326 family)
MVNSGIIFDDSYDQLKIYEKISPVTKTEWIEYLYLLLYWKNNRCLIQLYDDEIEKLIEILKEK